MTCWLELFKMKFTQKLLLGGSGFGEIDLTNDIRLFQFNLEKLYHFLLKIPTSLKSIDESKSRDINASTRGSSITRKRQVRPKKEKKISLRHRGSFI